MLGRILGTFQRRGTARSKREILSGGALEQESLAVAREY